MNRTENFQHIFERTNQMEKMLEKEGLTKGIDFFRTGINSIEKYDKTIDNEECILRIVLSIPTGARDGTFFDPSEKALEYEKKIEKKKQKKSVENKKEQQQKKEKEKQETYQLVIEFLQNNNEVSAMYIQKNINKPLTLVVVVLRQLEKEGKIIKIDREKNLPFLYKLV